MHTTTVYFTDGQYTHMVPPPPNGFYEDRDLAYDAEYIVSDGVPYDLSNPSSILSIEVPSFRASYDGSPVRGLDYILRMKAGNCLNRYEFNICSALLWKSTELMLSNKFSGWRKEDYDRIVYWHYEMGMPDDAERARAYLEQHQKYTRNQFDASAEKILGYVLSNSESFNSDLVVFHHYASGCCAECSKLSGRVYSISGKNRKYPQLPEYAKMHGNFHPACRCSMSNYLGGKVYLKGKQVTPLVASWRPYVDIRSKREKQAYEEYLQLIDERHKQAEEYIEQCKARGERRVEYALLKKHLPDIAPKSFSGYSRMKNMKSKNFLKLVEAAAQKGIKIDIPK